MLDLRQYSKTRLFSVRKALAGSVGDTSIDRERLETYLTGNFSPEQLEQALRETSPGLESLREKVAAREREQERAQSIPQTTETTMTESHSPADTAEKLALELVQALKQQKTTSTQAMDEDKVRDIVRECITYLFGINFPKVIFSETEKPKVVHKAFVPVYKRLKLGLPVLLTGPAGCGKTHLAEQLAAELKLTFGMLSCSEGMSESHLLGYLLPDSTGAIEYRPSAFVTLYSEGGLFLLDELDAADPNTLLVLNSALANRKLFVPQAGRVFTMHQDFRIIATANTFGTGATGTYAGRNRLDASTLDRFRAGIVQMDYDTALESLIVPDNPALTEWVRRTREAIQSRGLKHIMSTRTLIAFNELIQAGETLMDIQASYYLDWTDQERGR